MTEHLVTSTNLLVGEDGLPGVVAGAARHGHGSFQAMPGSFHLEYWSRR